MGKYPRIKWPRSAAERRADHFFLAKEFRVLADAVDGDRGCRALCRGASRARSNSSCDFISHRCILMAEHEGRHIFPRRCDETYLAEVFGYAGAFRDWCAKIAIEALRAAEIDPEDVGRVLTQSWSPLRPGVGGE